MYIETSTRSMAKTVVWRVIATVITGSVVYYYTGELLQASKITLVAAGLSMVFYYFFERIWNMISWGKVNKNP